MGLMSQGQGLRMSCSVIPVIENPLFPLFSLLDTGASAERRRTFVLQLRITTPHYGHLILQMAVYAL